MPSVDTDASSIDLRSQPCLFVVAADVRVHVETQARGGRKEKKQQLILQPQEKEERVHRGDEQRALMRWVRLCERQSG